jgi:hypothetical protein
MDKDGLVVRIWDEFGPGAFVAMGGIVIILAALGLRLFGISVGPGAARGPLLTIGIVVLVVGLFWSLVTKLEQRRGARGGRPSAVPAARPVVRSRRARLEAKLDRLYGLQGCPFVLVGSVYLDVILHPIGTTKLRPAEWSNIGSIRCTLGGSGLWVGRYLWELYGQKSSLLSIKGGGDDPFTREFERLIGRERRTWLQNRLVADLPNTSTAVTVHLVQGNNSFTSMFTHTGVLAGLGWGHIEGQLDKRLARGGILHISGYMKTNLCLDLQPYLRKLGSKALICIDHGRLIPELVSGDAVRAIQDVFQMGLVDVYFCTYQELLDLYGLGYGGSAGPGEVDQTLDELAKSGKLPIVTVVRDSNLPGVTKAYAIIEESVWPLKGKGGASLISSPVGPVVGPSNAFNAAMMYELVHGPRVGGFEELVVDAGNEALRRWAQCA